MPPFAPSPEQFSSWYREAPSLDEHLLRERLAQASDFPEYSLLSSFLCRCLGSKTLERGESALQWAEQAIAYLEDKRTLKKAWGSDTDYTASLNASIVLLIRCLSMEEEPSKWEKAERLSKDFLASGFPHIYDADNSKDGVNVALMRMGLLNRLGLHAPAMELGTRIQEAAQKHHDHATEVRSGFHWALAALLQSKMYAINHQTQDAEALRLSSFHVLTSLLENTSTHTLLANVLPIVHRYVQWNIASNPPDDTHWLESFPGDALWALLEIVEQHGNLHDEYLAGHIVTLLNDMQNECVD